LSSNSSKAGSSTKSKAKSTSAPASRAEQARAAAESAVDVPVGAVLEVGDRVAGLVEPFSGRGAAQKQLKSYGTQLRRSVKRSERRGASARRKAAAEARKTRTRVEREARKRQQRVEERVRKVADQLPAFR
jgi:hypothetical protein